MKISDLKRSGHAPSLFSAFLHFDISFMVWVILGALAPFIVSDLAFTGPNLRVTPNAAVGQGQYALIIRKPDPKKQEGGKYILAIKEAANATRPSVKPIEKFALDNADPETVRALNAQSKLIHIEVPAGVGNPNENVFPLASGAMLASQSKTYQTLANGLTAGEKGLLIAVPLLGSAFFRLLFGFLSDQFGSKRVGIASLIATLIPLVWGWLFAKTFGDMLIVGALLGIAGASFAVALPLASRWYPPELQGLAMGIAGMGNSGTVLATLFAPFLARIYGWHAVMGMLSIPVLLVLVVFALLAKDAPGTRKKTTVASYLAVLKQPDTYTFCLLYFVTFGGFVGLSSFLNGFFVDQFDVAKVAVGIVTAPLIIAGSLLRPVGGGLADRLGGIRMLTILYAVVILSMLGIGFAIGNQSAVMILLFIGMGCLGMGNGSVFQLVPQRFRSEIGAMTGLVGATGGVGGFYLNVLLGNLKDATGTYASGFWAFAATALVALIVLRLTAPAWTRSWLGAGGIATSRTPEHAVVSTAPNPTLEPTH
jgi:NNP family nitrate/nitrite transporter-like MFS transporter